MTTVFISYSHADQPFATRLASALPALGIEPWIDQGGIHGGARWSSSIQNALDACDALILVLSPESMASGNVEDEWQYMLDKGKPVVPVLLTPTDVHFQLGRIQHIDFHGQPFETALPQLVEGVRQAIESVASEGSGKDADDGVGRAKSSIGPPTGTVTFLFTDIEGSTERWEQFPDAMPDALERHDELMGVAITDHGGYVFKTIGDAFCAAFARAGDALDAAIASQRVLAEEEWSAYGDRFKPLLSRMALHTGEATERGGDYFGPPVNRVARLEAAGHGGQLLISQATQLVVRDRLPEGCELRDWGEHRLKDLLHSEHIYQIADTGLPFIDTPPRTAEALNPRDRVQVVEAEPARADAAHSEVVSEANVDERDADSPWFRLEAAVLDDTAETVTLTPAEAQAIARHKPAEWREYRLGRIAEWSQPRYRLDGRFVGLSLLIDQGEESVQGRWLANEDQFEDLGELLDATDDPAIVVLGPPGGGKSTLLRRLELDTAIRELRGEGNRRVTFFIALNTFKPARPGDPWPAPAEWLAERWAVRAPDLPPLDDLLAEGRVTLLLDALNEMPAAGESDFHERVGLWKDWLVRMSGEHSGNRVVFSCRSLDYSQSLSTPDLRVPQVRIEPLTDEQIGDFIALYSPGNRWEIWSALEGSPQLDVLRSPYFLALLVEQVEATGDMPAGRAGLFTGFVRQALRREVERGGELFKPGPLLASRDLKRLAGWKWKGAFDLPERGVLIPRLTALAHAMQADHANGERSQVRIDIDDALELLDSDDDESILTAGQALAILDEDQAADELMYIHQLVQEFFAARELAKAPDPELVRVKWREAEIEPTVDEVIDGLDPADPLPPLPGTGWEETTILAAAMSSDPVAFLRGVMERNLALSGRAAVQPELALLLPEDVLDELRWALVERSCDPAADLRDRIACGDALGDLGDPRFERRTEQHGEYLMPPLVEIPGGLYPIGDDEPIELTATGMSGALIAHVPKHTVAVETFQIGKFPVTNAEWACFIAAGGYENERWWDSEGGWAWRRGELANEGAKANNRTWRLRFLKNPEVFEQMVEEGRFADDKTVERWRGWMELDDAAYESALDDKWQAKRETEPRFWQDARLSNPSQPVVGVNWYEARAYCVWLSAQAGVVVRLPSEVEWEAAARGRAGRRYAYGNSFNRLAGNTIETHVARTSPVGVFPSGRTPEGVDDLTGNVHEWTSSLFGEQGIDEFETEFPYPYDPADGREDVGAAPSVRRVARGGGWGSASVYARSTYRDHYHPSSTDHYDGLRVVVASPI